LRDFFREDNIFIAFGQEKHSIYDFDLTNDGTAQMEYDLLLNYAITTNMDVRCKRISHSHTPDLGLRT